MFSLNTLSYWFFQFVSNTKDIKVDKMTPHGNTQITIEEGTFCRTVDPVDLTSQ